MDMIFSTDGFLLGTLVPFLFVLTVVVFVHEMGHYLVGRWCGIGVEAFSVGFGPELVGFNDRHGTRWKLSAIPLGGYVKFVGDLNAASTPDPDMEEKLTEEQKRVAFHTQSLWKKAATIFAGPGFNFLLTIVILTVMLSLYGRAVADPKIATIQPESAAAVAGFVPGDRFVSLDGQPVVTFEDVQRYVTPRAGQEITFVVERDGQQVTLIATPRPTERTDPLGNTMTVGLLGVLTDQEAGNFRRIEYSFPQAMGEALTETGYIMARTGEFLVRMVAGREDRCQLGGPVKIANMASAAAKQGFDWLVQLTAMLSIGIGILNLIPLPPLDGGHLFFYAVEAVTRRPVPDILVEWTYRIGFFALLMLMAFVFWNDLVAC